MNECGLTFHQTVNKKVTVNTTAGQSVGKKKKKTTVILGYSIVKRIQGRKLGRRSNKMLS